MQVVVLLQPGDLIWAEDDEGNKQQFLWNRGPGGELTFMPTGEEIDGDDNSGPNLRTFPGGAV